MTALFLAGAVGASAADHFSLTIGSHDMLVVLGSNGEQKATLPIPSISQNVTIDNTTCQISYGRDANDMVTAIVAPNPAQPQDLHFSILGKEIDTDRAAVVTLTFSKEFKSVKVDPGYVGEVDVNSRRLQHDAALMRGPQSSLMARTASPTQQSSLEDGAEPASAVAAATKSYPAANTLPPISTPIPPAVPSVASNQPANIQTEGTPSVHAPLPTQANDASQLPFTATATPGPSTVSVVGSETAPKQHTLYWSEPITPPSGQIPHVASNEMKLLEVQGDLTITSPGGSSQAGATNLIVPSGSTISTSGGGSAALFMGGVNSIRLLPNTEVQVTQQLNGSVRETRVDLHKGTVFSRVGHRDGERQDYRVVSPEGVSMAKGTEFADSLANGHHYVFVVKGIVAMLINGIQTGLLTPTSSSLASGAMPTSDDGNRVLFQILTDLQPFQTKLQIVINHINNGTATPSEIGFFDSLRQTFSVAVDDVYDPTHPNAFLGAFTSTTGSGDAINSPIERPQDLDTPNPSNPFNGFQEGAAHPFVTPFTSPF
jgi:hypothetical protein